MTNWLDVEEVRAEIEKHPCIDHQLEVLKAIADLEDSADVRDALTNWDHADVYRKLAEIILVAREVVVGRESVAMTQDRYYKLEKFEAENARLRKAIKEALKFVPDANGAGWVLRGALAGEDVE